VEEVVMATTLQAIVTTLVAGHPRIVRGIYAEGRIRLFPRFPGPEARDIDITDLTENWLRIGRYELVAEVKRRIYAAFPPGPAACHGRSTVPRFRSYRRTNATQGR
jgi:hypothetical protein